MQSILVHIFHNHARYSRFSYTLQLYLLYCKIFYCIFIIWQYLDLIKESKNTHHSILNIFIIRQVRVSGSQLRFSSLKPKPKPTRSQPKPKPQPCAYNGGYANVNCLCMDSAIAYNTIYRINATTRQSIPNRHKELTCKNYTPNLNKHTVNVESLTRSHKTVISHLK
jgi:hypothetical protein